MSDFHSIRLQGPWQATVEECFDSDSVNSKLATDLEPKRLKIPGDWKDWLGADFRGRVRFVRPFNLPTNLEPDQAVWLVVESVAGSGLMELNGSRLGQWDPGDPPFRTDVRHLLKPSNQLVVVVESIADTGSGSPILAGGLTGSIRLEIAN